MTDRQQAVFAALADPTRRQLLHDLAANSPKTASALAHKYPMSRQGLVKHLSILETAGLVDVERRGREKRYSLSPEPLRELDRFVDELAAVWDKRLSRLKAFVESTTDAGVRPPTESG